MDNFELEMLQDDIRSLKNQLEETEYNFKSISAWEENEDENLSAINRKMDENKEIWNVLKDGSLIQLYEESQDIIRNINTNRYEFMQEYSDNIRQQQNQTQEMIDEKNIRLVQIEQELKNNEEEYDR